MEISDDVCIAIEPNEFVALSRYSVVHQDGKVKHFVSVDELAEKLGLRVLTNARGGYGRFLIK